MKKMLYFALLLVFIFSLIFTQEALALKAPEAGEPAVSAPAAVLMEKETGQVVFSKNPQQRLSPASITKIMTMLLIAEDMAAGRLSEADTVSVSRRAASFGGSCVYLEEGEQMSAGDMLKCIAVVSANDCAVAMAEHLCGTEELFVERMNSRALELGLKNTHFMNCTGLFDPKEHYTSAEDVALLSRELLLRHPEIKKYTSIWTDSIRGGEFELANTNKLVSRYAGCTGLKTGYTSGARYCLAASAERDGMEFIAVIMGAGDSELRNAEAASLLNYGFARCQLCPLRPSEPLQSLPVELGRKQELQLYYDAGDYTLVPRGSQAPGYSVQLPERVSAPVEKDQIIGRLFVKSGEKLLAEVYIRSAEAVPRLGFLQLFKRLGAGMLGI